MDEFASKEIARIRTLVGEKGQVIGTSSQRMHELHLADVDEALYLGGLILRFVSHEGLKSCELMNDKVGSALMHEAIGDRYHAVLVDNGLLRLNEAEEVHKNLTEHLRINLTVVDASQRFLDQLAGIRDPEQKRKVIGRNFSLTSSAHAAFH